MAWPVSRPSPFTFLRGQSPFTFLFFGGGASNIISEPNLDIFGSTAKKEDIEIEN